MLLLALTSTKTEIPQWSGDIVTAQLDVQVTSDVDLDKFGQPHIVRHACEPLD